MTILIIRLSYFTLSYFTLSYFTLSYFTLSYFTLSDFKLSDFFKMLGRVIKASSKPIGVFILTILLISTLNWIGIQFMATHCATWGWFGPISNLFSLGSPLCMFVNNLQVGLANYYITIWAAATTTTLAWISSRLSNNNV